MLRLTYFGGATFLLGLISFVVTAWGGPAVLLVWALIAGALAVAAVALISHTGEPASEIAAMLMAGVVLAASGTLKWISGSANVAWPDAVAVLVAMGSAWALDLLVAERGARTCFICKLQIDERVPFGCPRCHQVICTRPSCWIARHFRCKYCDERDVIIFPIDEKWWQTRLGPRVREGSCNSCYKEAHEADLRACGRCKWTMCRRCWDYHNGVCSHCGWIVPDPPAVLRPFLSAPQQDDRQPYVGPQARRGR